MLPYVDFFVPSVEELAFMIDRPLYREWVGRANGRDLTVVIRLQEIRALAETLISWEPGSSCSSAARRAFILLQAKERI